jgi:hypothetical protein
LAKAGNPKPESANDESMTNDQCPNDERLLPLDIGHSGFVINSSLRRLKNPLRRAE